MRKGLTAVSHWGISSTKPPSSLMALACVELTQNQPVHWPILNCGRRTPSTKTLKTPSLLVETELQLPKPPSVFRGSYSLWASLCIYLLTLNKAFLYQLYFFIFAEVIKVMIKQIKCIYIYIIYVCVCIYICRYVCIYAWIWHINVSSETLSG